MAQSKVKFVKQYTIAYNGAIFMRFESEDGRIAEIRVRDHRDCWMLYTRAEAKAIATEHLYGDCGGPQEGCVVTVHADNWAGPGFTRRNDESADA